MESSDLFSDEDDLVDPVMQALLPIIEWISETNHREQCRFLEQHLELLNPGTEKVLKLLLAVLDDRPDELRQLVQVSEDQVTTLFERYKLLLGVLGSLAGGVELLT